MLQIRLRQISQLPTRLRRLLRNRLATLLGIGFFVSAEGHFLTDGLLTRDCQHITSSHGGNITKMAFDQTSDLALWFPVRTISALAGLWNDRRMIQISTPVQPGNSGSPLLDQSGNVVGIVAGKLNAIQVAETR